MSAVSIGLFLLRWHWMGRRKLLVFECSSGEWVLMNPSHEWIWFFFNHRWKIHEACMLALGSVKNVIADSVKNGRIQFDMHGFLTNVVLADLNLSGMVQIAVTWSPRQWEMVWMIHFRPGFFRCLLEIFSISWPYNLILYLRKDWFGSCGSGN